MTRGATVEVADLVKRYGSEHAVDHVSLRVEAGEFVTLLGSSGSGKTTTLMMIAGFVTPDAGAIRIEGKDIARLPPERRDLGVVFQSYALFPHYGVFENIAFPLRLRRRPQERSIGAFARRSSWSSSRRSATGASPSSRAGSSSAWRSPAPSSSRRRSC